MWRRPWKATGKDYASNGDWLLWNPSEVLSQFENLRATLRHEDREDDEDVVTDVINRNVGWCHVDSRLF